MNENSVEVLKLSKAEEDALIVAGESRLLMPYPGIDEQSVAHLVEMRLLQRPAEHYIYVVTWRGQELMRNTKRKVLVAEIPKQPDLVLEAPGDCNGDFRGGILADEIENADRLEDDSVVFTLKVKTYDLWTLATMGEWEPN